MWEREDSLEAGKLWIVWFAICLIDLICGTNIGKHISKFVSTGFYTFY